MRLTPRTTALLVIDMQNAFLDPQSILSAEGGMELARRLRDFIVTCRDKGITVVFTKSVFRADGSDLGRVGELFPTLRETDLLREGAQNTEIIEILQPEPGELVISKPRYSAFFKTELDDYLKGKGIDTLIICGVWTNVCCESTARDGLFRDYTIVFLSDGTATGSLPDKGWGPVDAETIQRVTLTDIAMHIGSVVTMDEALKMMG